MVSLSKSRGQERSAAPRLPPLVHVRADGGQGPFEQRHPLLAGHQIEAAHDRDPRIHEGRQLVGKEGFLADAGLGLEQAREIHPKDRAGGGWFARHRLQAAGHDAPAPQLPPGTGWIAGL